MTPLLPTDGLLPSEREDVERANADPGRRLLIRGGAVLSMDPKVGDHAQADILVVGNRIAAVEPDLDSLHDTVALVIDAYGMVVVPGFHDAHRHLWHSMLRDLNEEELGAPLIDASRRLGPRSRPVDRYAAALLGGIASLDAGITTVQEIADHAGTPAHALAGAQALADLGLRAVCACSASEGADLGELRTAVGSIGGARLSTRLAVCTLTPKDLVRVRAAGMEIVVDGALDPAPSTTLIELGGLGLLDDDITLVHADGLTSEAWDALGAGGVRVAVCPGWDDRGSAVPSPREEPPVQQAVDRGLIVGIGTDIRCREAVSMFTQMRTVHTLQRMSAYRRLRAEDLDAPRPLSTRDVLHMTTLGGAQLLGLDAVSGSLTPGKAADLVLIEQEDAIRVATIEEAYARVVLTAGVPAVDTVLVDGVIRKARGDLVGIDLARAGALADASRAHLVEVATSLHRRAG